VYSYSDLLHPFCILLYGFIGLCCFLPLVKKWRAREE